MNVAFLRSASPSIILVSMFLCGVGCQESESKSRTNGKIPTDVEDGKSNEKRQDIDDGADPSSAVTKQRQRAHEYLNTLQVSQNETEERDTILELIAWLKGLKKGKAVKIEVPSDASEKSTIHVICFPPTYASLEYQFKNAEHIMLFDPVLYVE